MAPNSQHLSVPATYFPRTEGRAYNHPPIKEIIRTSNDPDEIRTLLSAMTKSGSCRRSTILKCQRAATARIEELEKP